MSHNKQLNTNYSRKANKHLRDCKNKTQEDTIWRTQSLQKLSSCTRAPLFHMFFKWPNWTHLHIGDQDLAKDLNLGKVLEAFFSSMMSFFSGSPANWWGRLGDFCILTSTIHGYFMQPNGLAGVGQGAAASKVVYFSDLEAERNGKIHRSEVWRFGFNDVYDVYVFYVFGCSENPATLQRTRLRIGWEPVCVCVKC